MSLRFSLCHDGGRTLMLVAILLFLSVPLSLIATVQAKGIHVSIVAPWKETPLLQEGCEWAAANVNLHNPFYHCLNGVWQYVKASVGNNADMRGGALALSQQSQYSILLDILKDFHLFPSQLGLLEMQLAARSYSPVVAAHWQLAKLAVNFAGGCSAEGRPFALVGGTAYCDVASLQTVLTALDITTQRGKSSQTNETIALFGKLDHVHANSKGPHVVILYGIIGEERTMHLLQAVEHHFTKVKFSFRHLPVSGAVLPDGSTPDGVSWESALFIQGYGVTVDLKNVEYKAMDEKQKSDEKNETEVNIKEKPFVDNEASSDEPIGGFDIQLIRRRFQGLETQLKSFEEYLTEAIGREEMKVDFHIWEAEHMSTTAAKYLMEMKDSERLNTLREILTRFPLYASKLSKRGASTSESLSYESRFFMEFMSEIVPPGESLAFINGRRQSGAPLDFHTLLGELEKDERLLLALSRIIASTHIPEIDKDLGVADVSEGMMAKVLASVTRTMQTKTPSSKSDKSHKPCIIVPERSIYWMNNIETDPAYSTLPTQLKSILHSSFYGMPNFPRRNLLNVLAILDFTRLDGFQTILTISTWVTRQQPFRVGFAIFDPKWTPTALSTLDKEGTNFVVQPSVSTVSLCIAATLWELGRDGTGNALEFLVDLANELNTEGSSVSEKSVRAASMAALVTAKKRPLDEVLSDTSFLEDYHSTQQRLRDLRLTQLPITLINGKRYAEGINTAVQQSFSSEVEKLREFIYMDKLEDGEEDVYEAILRLHDARDRYSAAFVEEELYADWSSKEVIDFMHHWPFFSPTPSTQSSPPSSASQTSDSGNITAPPTVSAVMMLRSPITTMDLEAIATTTRYISNCNGTHSACSSTRLTYILCTERPTEDDARRSLGGDVERLLRHNGSNGAELLGEFLTALASVTSREESVDDPKIYETLLRRISLTQELQDVLNNNANDPLAEATHTKLRRGFCEKIATNPSSLLSPSSVHAMELHINGRRILWEVDFDERDLADVVTMALPFAKSSWKALRRVNFRRLTDNAAAVDTTGYMASKVACLAALLASDVAERGEAVEETLFGRAPAQGMKFTAGPASSKVTRRHQLTIVVDPVSRDAQRLVSLCEYVANAPLNTRCLVYLNPTPHVDKPMRNFYRFVGDYALRFDATGRVAPPMATFRRLPSQHLLTLGIDDPESWTVFPLEAAYDLDNIVLAKLPEAAQYLTATYRMESILITGNARLVGTPTAPRGLPLLIRPTRDVNTSVTVSGRDTLVMTTLGYFQLQGAPGVWYLGVQPGDIAAAFRISHINDMAVNDGAEVNYAAGQSLPLVVSAFTGEFLHLQVENVPGQPRQTIEEAVAAAAEGSRGVWPPDSPQEVRPTRPTINIFSVASGHLYERFQRMMMQSVMKTSSDVHGANTTRIKFWLIENFISPQFKELVPLLAKHYGFEVGFVTYRWPYWLRKQTEKQRTIWGYKILFLDVLFPLDVDRVVFVDADQTVRSDLHELYNMDIGDAPTAYTPFCREDPNEATMNFRFWNHGFWAEHLRGRPYHISAIYLVNLRRLRSIAGGDKYRAIYSQLSRDPNSLANLDQDLPNYMQAHVPIFPLPEEWLWCETWCGAKSKSKSKTIDLCNNPLTKIPKLENAKLIIDGWETIDAELEKLSEQLLQSQRKQY